MIFAQHDSDGSEAPQGRCSRIALFTFGPCSDHTSEVKSTRTRASSHLLCGHRRLIVSFSSRRVPIARAKGSAALLQPRHTMSLIPHAFLEFASEGHHQRMVKATWKHVGIRWSTFCGVLMKHRAARRPTLTVFTFFFVHEGIVGPRNCSNGTEDGQKSYVLCLWVFFMCGFSTSIRPPFSVFTISHLFTDV